MSGNMSVNERFNQIENVADTITDLLNGVQCFLPVRCLTTRFKHLWSNIRRARLEITDQSVNDERSCLPQQPLVTPPKNRIIPKAKSSPCDEMKKLPGTGHIKVSPVKVSPKPHEGPGGSRSPGGPYRPPGGPGRPRGGGDSYGGRGGSAPSHGGGPGGHRPPGSGGCGDPYRNPPGGDDRDSGIPPGGGGNDPPVDIYANDYRNMLPRSGHLLYQCRGPRR